MEIVSPLADFWSIEELQDVVKALQGVTYLPGSHHKRFARAMGILPIEKMTEKQIDHIARVAWRYRRQLSPRVVTLLGRPWVSKVLAAEKPTSAPAPPPRQDPVCPYCGRIAIHRLHPQRHIRKEFGGIWICEPCEAWVGCIKGTAIPSGALADHTLRRHRVAAWRAFSELWQSGRMTKEAACQWLAEKLSIEPRDCRINRLEAGQLVRAVEFCAEELKRAR